MKLSHWIGRFFPGSIVEEKITDSGTVRQYASGYIEHIDGNTGVRTDVARDLHRRRTRRRAWKCIRTQGGGEVVLDRLTRDDAMARCARDLGRVIYVDDYCGFIFYSDSPSGSVNVSPTLPQR